LGECALQVQVNLGSPDVALVNDTVVQPNDGPGACFGGGEDAAALYADNNIFYGSMVGYSDFQSDSANIELVDNGIDKGSYQSDGILLTGGDACGNIISGNQIGLLYGNAIGNTLAGVRISGGAHDTRCATTTSRTITRVSSSRAVCTTRFAVIRWPKTPHSESISATTA